MYIFFMRQYNYAAIPIYSDDDLGHYWYSHAALYCGLLLILLESCYDELAARVRAEPNLVSKQIIRIFLQWRVFMKHFQS